MKGIVPLVALLLASPLLSACADLPAEPSASAGLETTDPLNSAAGNHSRTNAAVDWNEAARDLVISTSSNVYGAFRAYAYVSLAQYNAAAEVKRRTRGRVHPSTTAAIVRSSADVLIFLFPARAEAIEAMAAEQLESSNHRGRPDTGTEAGIEIGRAVAAEVIERAKADNYFLTFNGTVPTGPGLWFSSSVPPAPPIGAHLGEARTFFLRSSDQFRPPPPPVFGSTSFLAGLDEVRQVAANRTPEQLAIAQFWAMPAGTYSPPGYWNEEAARLALKYRLGEIQTAHLLALMNMTAFDAIIASHEAKFTYWFIRPTQADPTIPLAIGLPNFPSYPSNHATISSAMATIIGEQFRAERSRLRGLAEEAALSRLYGSIHYRFDNETGLQMGRRIASWALAHDVRHNRPFDLD
jgi:membrane-associated phospholipid phosphatase